MTTKVFEGLFFWERPKQLKIIPVFDHKTVEAIFTEHYSKFSLCMMMFRFGFCSVSLPPFRLTSMRVHSGLFVWRKKGDCSFNGVVIFKFKWGGGRRKTVLRIKKIIAISGERGLFLAENCHHYTKEYGFNILQNTIMAGIHSPPKFVKDIWSFGTKAQWFKSNLTSNPWPTLMKNPN